jgi:Bacterial Ig-like domain
MTATYQEVEALTRYSSKVPTFEIESSDPASAATGVPTNKIIMVTMSIAMDPTTINNTNVTISPNVTRTVSVQPDGRTIRISPTALSASTSYTVTVTSNVRGLYGSSYVPGVQDTISFTTA